jgi:hypothetical protein
MNLNIADFIIRLKSNIPLFIDEGYKPFVSTVETEKADLEITCLPGLPLEKIQEDELLFEAKNEALRFYSVYRHGNGLGFLLYHQNKENEVQQLAFLDDTFKQWTVYSRLTEDGCINPLKYPLGPIILYYLAVNNYAIMIHASGVYNGEKGRIFTGFSGTGKSTMAEIWRSSGYQIINDDRMILRKQEDGSFRMYNTPMYYPDQPKSAPVNAIHLIRHFPENMVQRIHGAKAVSKVMAFCIQNNFDKQFIQNYIDFISDLCSHAGIYETGFVPNSSIIRHIEANENE